jgi:hypothetical protein
MRRLVLIAWTCTLLVSLAVGYAVGTASMPVVPRAAAQGECQPFDETGKSICGRFLVYWRANGGLAQQGLPLSDEFDERSEVNGQTYKVQYFERAVFEYHPENAPPFDVLLSLLGREKFLAKYPSTPPTPLAPAQSQELTGRGSQAVPLALRAGLTTMRFTHSGQRNFIVNLLDQDARPVDLLVNRIGSYDGTTALRIPADGQYTFNVQADGDWKISLTQVGPADFAQAVALPQSFKGTGAQNTPLFNAQAGALRLVPKYSGERNFIVKLLDSQGRTVDLVVNVIGPHDGSKVVRINTAGVYLLVVEASGEWSIEASQ